MFGLFSSKSQDKVVDGIYSGLDKLVLTDEERLDFENKKAELKKSFLPLFEPYILRSKTPPVTSGRSTARLPAGVHAGRTPSS